MKEVSNKKILIGIVIGLIMSFNLGIGATALYNSNQVSYNQNDSESEVESVKEALDELYTKSFGNLELVTKSTSIPFSYTVPEKGKYLIVGVGAICKSNDNNNASHTLKVDGVVVDWDQTSAQKSPSQSGYFARTYVAYKIVEVNSTIDITTNSYIADFLVYKVG